MLRRNIVTLAAAVPFTLLATRAFAQEVAPTPATRPVEGADETGMGEAETTHAEQTGMIGSLSLLQSRLAVGKASNEKVKQFAEWEVAEQETIGDILKSMKMGMDDAQGALLPPTDDEARAMAGADAESMLTEMEALSGAEFDKAYVAANLEGHQKLLAVQEDYLTAGTKREHLLVAKLARGQITEHIAHLEELQAALG
jgi:predicted outer membrane protein